MKNVLIISASDSIAGAGMQTDLKVCTLLGVYATTCLTAITAQNTGEVREVFALPSSLIGNQIDCIIEDLRPDAVKIGLLGSIAVVDAVVEAIKKYSLKNVVLDPVLVATCGDGLTAGMEVSEYSAYLAQKLFPLATLITPNVREATMLSGIDAMHDAAAAAKAICEKYNCAVLLKGGDAAGDVCTDLFIRKLQDKQDFEMQKFPIPRIDTVNTHGSGCSLSSAIAAFLATGYPLLSAIQNAKVHIAAFLDRGKYVSFGNHGYGPTILDFPKSFS